MAVTRVHILKMLELALVIVCLGLHYKTYGGYFRTYHEIVIPGAAFGGYLVIMAVSFVGIFSGQPINKRLDIIFSMIGCALFVAAGSFAIEYYKDTRSSDEKNMGLAKGSLAIINGVIFLIDAALSFRGE
ncbi:Protein snakeskin [Blattella germanica]|nr:Protein snakeskin [Blattella germanica]